MFFLFVATERLCRRSPTARHEASPPPQPRYQLLRALRAMARGEAMVVEQRMPPLDERLRDTAKRESWLGSLYSEAGWRDPGAVEPILVPGTAFPALVGHILLLNGWSAPSETPHWVPNLRLFNLTEAGYRAFAEAQEWWRALTPLERLRLAFAE